MGILNRTRIRSVLQIGTGTLGNEAPDFPRVCLFLVPALQRENAYTTGTRGAKDKRYPICIFTKDRGNEISKKPKKTLPARSGSDPCVFV